MSYNERERPDLKSPETEKTIDGETAVVLMSRDLSPSDAILHALAVATDPRAIPIFVPGGRFTTGTALEDPDRPSPEIISSSPRLYFSHRERLLNSLERIAKIPPERNIRWWKLISHYGAMCQPPTRQDKPSPRVNLVKKGFSANLYDQLWQIILTAPTPHDALKKTTEYLFKQEGKKLNAMPPCENEVVKLVREMIIPTPYELAPKGNIEINLPSFESIEPGAMPTGERTISFPDLIHHLAGEVVMIVIGGPPNSGKSTLCVSLKTAMEQRAMQAGVNTRCFTLDLDAGSPTVELIEKGMGENRDLHQQAKQEWNLKLALETLDNSNRFVAYIKNSGGGIIFADLPGKPDHLQRIVASIADAMIIITSKWDKETLKKWRQSAGKIGVPEIAEFRSRTLGEEMGSYPKQVRIHTPPQLDFLSGRIDDLRRITKNPGENLLVDFLAQILLHHTLPGVTIAREHQRDKWVTILKRIYGIDK